MRISRASVSVIQVPFSPVNVLVLVSLIQPMFHHRNVSNIYLYNFVLLRIRLNKRAGINY
jgi:hypothetical protein